MKKILVLIAVAIMTLSLCAGCGNNTSPPADTEPGATTETPSGTTTEAEDLNETSVLNMAWTSSIGTDSVFQCPWFGKMSMYPYFVFDRLIQMGPDGSDIVPGLAQSMDISSDGLTYTFTLEENVKWHDGTPFTAEDVLFTYNTIVKYPMSGFTSFLSVISGVQEVIDGNADTISGLTSEGNKVIFSLDNPDNTITLSSFAAIEILPKHLLQDVDPVVFDEYEAYWKKPIGTGMYMIDEVSFPNYFSLVRNDDYFGEKGKIKQVVFKSYDTGGAEAITADMIAGNLDFSYGDAMNDINRAKNIATQNPDVKVEIVPAAYMRYFAFNLTGAQDGNWSPDVKKEEVRQAFNLLIDKEMIASFYAGQAVSLTTFVNPALPEYNTAIPLFSRDVDKAKQMLEEADFDFSRTIRLLYYYDDPITADIMELVKQNFAEAGVKIEPFLASGDLNALLYEQKNYELFYGGSNVATAMTHYDFLIAPGTSRDLLFEDMEFRTETFGKMMTEYKATLNDVDRKKIGDQIQVEAQKYGVIIPVYSLNKVIQYNASKLTLDDSIFIMDLELMRDWKLSSWELLK